jgi:hypothetical protein
MDINSKQSALVDELLLKLRKKVDTLKTQDRYDINTLLDQFETVIHNSRKRAFPVGIKELDLEILATMDDKSVTAACISDKYLATICNDDAFWRKRIISQFGTEYDLKDYLMEDDTYKQAYQRLKNEPRPIEYVAIDRLAYIGIKHGYMPFFDKSIPIFNDITERWFNEAMVISIRYNNEETLMKLVSIFKKNDSYPDNRVFSAVGKYASGSNNIARLMLENFTLDTLSESAIRRILGGIKKENLNYMVGVLVDFGYGNILTRIYVYDINAGTWNFTLAELFAAFYNNIETSDKLEVFIPHLYNCDDIIYLFSKVIVKEDQDTYLNELLRPGDDQLHCLVQNLPDLIPDDILYRMERLSPKGLDYNKVIEGLPADFPYSNDSFDGLPLVSLKLILKKRGLKQSGKREELVSRLIKG